MLSDLRYDGEHVCFEDLASMIGRWRSKEGGTRNDAEETGSPANILASVLCSTCNGGKSTKFELGQVLVLVRARPAEEGEPLFAQTVALFRCTWSTSRSETKAGLVGKRDRDNGLGGRGFKHVLLALDRKRSAGVHRHRPIGQRTANDYSGWSQTLLKTVLEQNR